MREYRLLNNCLLAFIVFFACALILSASSYTPNTKEYSYNYKVAQTAKLEYLCDVKNIGNIAPFLIEPATTFNAEVSSNIRELTLTVKDTKAVTLKKKIIGNDTVYYFKIKR